MIFNFFIIIQSKKRQERAFKIQHVAKNAEDQLKDTGGENDEKREIDKNEIIQFQVRHRSTVVDQIAW